MDPNKEFRRKKKYSSDQYGSPRPKQRIIMIRCDAVNCGHKTLIEHSKWIGSTDIICSNCGSVSWWSVL